MLNTLGLSIFLSKSTFEQLGKSYKQNYLSTGNHG